MFGFNVTYRDSWVMSQFSFSVMVLLLFSFLLTAVYLLFLHSASKQTIKRLLTFEGNSIATDGSNSIIDINLSLQGRVDMHHLKVNRNTAEPRV